MIYLDNSATTKPHPDVLKSFVDVTTKYYANPSSIHQFGGQAERLLLKSREQAAKLLKVHEEEIIFTSGGTEGNNIAIKGIALQHRSRGKHIITTKIEHPSVLETCESLESLGFEVTYLNVNEEGLISLDELNSSLRDDTILVSTIHVNSETGAVQPVKEIGKILANYPKIFYHVDHVQGLGKVPLNFRECHIDLCTCSGHKIHGLKGTGLLYVRSGVSLFPLFHGGHQEFALRSGTENVAGIVALVKALRLIKEREQKGCNHLQILKNNLLDGLEKMDSILINTTRNGAPHIINFSVPGLKPEVLIHILGEKEIYISTKSACSSKEQTESAVLKAYGFDSKRTSSALRVSLSYDNTLEEINIFLKEITEAIQQLQRVLE